MSEHHISKLLDILLWVGLCQSGNKGMVETQDYKVLKRLGHGHVKLVFHVLQSFLD